MTEAPDFAVEVEHRVDGPPETVFEYFTDPDKYRRWKGTDVELDPRPGGVYRVRVAAQVQIVGEYLDVEPPHRIRLTWGWESEVDLPSGLRAVPPGSSVVEFRFVPDGDGTIVRLRHQGLPSDVARWAHGLGWEAYLPRLARAVRGAGPGPDPTGELTAAYLRRDREAMAS